MRVYAKCFQTLVIGSWLTLMPMSVGRAADTFVPGPPIVVSISPDGVQRATVILDSYSYSPNHLVVESGTPVELTLTSRTTFIPHNFVMQELSAGISIEQDVGAGKTVIAKLVPTHPGLFPFFCDKRLWPMPSHRDKGMEGLLEVR
ncbi:MAG: quinol oxidase [Nitrospira sp.]|nr:MAG: quinol oxidase [Nitrospira sp.]